MSHSTQHDAKIKALEGRLNQLSDKLASFNSHAQQISELVPGHPPAGLDDAR